MSKRKFPITSQVVKGHCLRFGIRRQLLLGVLLLVIVPVVVAGIWVNYRMSMILSQQAQQELVNVGEDASLLLTHSLDMHKEKILGAVLEGDWSDPEARRTQLEALYQDGNGWSQLEYWDAQSGKLLASLPSVPLRLVNGQGESWFDNGLTQKGGVAVNAQETASQKGEGLRFTAIVRDSLGRAKGVLTARLPAGFLRDELRNTLSLPPKTHVWLVDPKNQFLLKPKTYAGEPEMFSQNFVQVLKQTQLVSVRTMSELGWTLIIASDRQTAQSMAGEVTKEISYITGAILLAALILALWYIGSLLYPVHKLMAQIRALSEGYSVQDLPPLPERRDEIGEAAAAFRVLAGQAEKMSRDLILSLVTALETRDPYTKYHSERVAIYARLLAQKMNLNPVKRENIVRAGLLHDVGKIGVPENILKKSGALTEAEWLEMQNHSRYGYDIVREVPAYMQAGIAEAVLQHHERWDGHGYPQGLVGENICLEARVLAVADTFDAMTSHRVYRRALSIDQALAEVERGSGGQFDPECAQAFLSLPISELRCYLQDRILERPVSEIC